MRKATVTETIRGVTVTVIVEVDESAWAATLPESDRLAVVPNRKRAQASLLRRAALGPLRHALREVGLAEPDRHGELLEVRAESFNDRGVQGRPFGLGAMRSA